MDALGRLSFMQSDFRQHYEHLLASVAKLCMPPLVCTIYDGGAGPDPVPAGRPVAIQ